MLSWEKEKTQYADLTKCWRSSSSWETEPNLEWTWSGVLNRRGTAVFLLGALLTGPLGVSSIWKLHPGKIKYQQGHTKQKAGGVFVHFLPCGFSPTFRVLSKKVSSCARKLTGMNRKLHMETSFSKAATLINTEEKLQRGDCLFGTNFNLDSLPAPQSSANPRWKDCAPRVQMGSENLSTQQEAVLWHFGANTSLEQISPCTMNENQQ